jgi:hypothetical protein
MARGEYGLSTISTLKIMAEPDAGSILLHHPIIDEVHSDNLRKLFYFPFIHVAQNSDS